MLQKFLSGLKLRAAFARVGFTQNQVYSISTYLNILAAFLFVSVQYYLWSAIFEHAVHGQYSLSDMLQYVLAAEVLSVCLHSNADRQLGQMVRTGSLAHVMLKPVAFTEQIFFESFGVNAYRSLFICVPLVLCSIFAFGVEYRFGAARLAGFLALAGLAYIFIYLFELLLGLISFFSVNTWGINSLKMAVITVFSGRFLPISAYPENFRALVDGLPFKIMYFEPLNFLIKGGDWAGMFIRQCGWIAAAFLAVFYLQRALLKKMVIQGG